MLPLTLLRTRTQKGAIKPIYARLEGEDQELAAMLINLFKTCVGRRKGELLEKAASYESAGFDFRLVRGLSLILQRCCEFKSESTVDSILARRLVFERASGEHFVATPSVRKQVMREVAEQLNLAPKQLEDSLYADLDEQLVLRKFNLITPLELIQSYNLSLTQTLLFRATFIEIKLSNYWKEVLRAVKYRGLIYSAENKDGVFKIIVDGPLSLLKQSQRYGVNFAKLLPAIVQADIWEINASIVRNSQFGKRIYQLRLTSGEVGEAIYSRRPLQEDVRPVRFDSLVEKRFFEEFSALRSGWKITREPSPLIAGSYVLIPDFLFEKHGVKVYFEIVGFWTTNYLEKKTKKLKQLQNIEMLIAASKQLACDKLRQVNGRIIFYKGKVPLKPILNRLRNIEEAIVRHETESVNIDGLVFEDDFVTLNTLIEKLKVSKEALKRRLRDVEINGYKLVGDVFISINKLRQIENKLASQTENSLSEALKTIEDEGVDMPYDLLHVLGYTVRWRGLDPQESFIEKTPKSIFHPCK